jgi:hypothetical protein
VSASRSTAYGLRVRRLVLYSVVEIGGSGFAPHQS